MRKGWSWACHRLPGPVPGKIPCWVPSKTTSPLPSPWLGLLRLRGGKPRSFRHVIIVRFPNPLAPDIQIHVSWGTRLCYHCRCYVTQYALIHTYSSLMSLFCYIFDKQDHVGPDMSGLMNTLFSLYVHKLQIDRW